MKYLHCIRKWMHNISYFQQNKTGIAEEGSLLYLKLFCWSSVLCKYFGCKAVMAQIPLMLNAMFNIKRAEISAKRAKQWWLHNKKSQLVKHGTAKALLIYTNKQRLKSSDVWSACKHTIVSGRLCNEAHLMKHLLRVSLITDLHCTLFHLSINRQCLWCG